MTRTRPQWVLWENVPGVLSIDGGRAFGSLLGGLAEFRYGFAYRVLDAQNFGVPQRRRRVFVVAHLGDWRRAAAVLFERHSLQGHPAPRRQERQSVAALTATSVGTCGADNNQGQAGHLNAMAHGQGGAEIFEDGGAPTLTCDHEAPILATCFNSREDPCVTGDVSGSLGSSRPQSQAVVFSENQQGEIRTSNTFQSLTSGGGKPGQGYPAISSGSTVRRLTPTECERLQGFPDGYTAIGWRGKDAGNCPDGPRYKALGNSMAVPVMRWIGGRIDMVSKL